jgi:hypothetical protein
LAFALDKGLFSLANEAWRINTVTDAWKNGPFRTKSVVFPRILNVLITMSKSLTLTIIRSELHTTFQLPKDATLRLPTPPQGSSPSSYENPVIYALVHCTHYGVTPTKSEYLKCLEMMKLYAAWYDSDLDPKWIAADKHASLTDYAVGLKPHRDWKELDDEIWKVDDDGHDIPHPRRYRRNHAQKQKIMKFIEQLEDRLAHIPGWKQDDPIPWSLCYIGWTRTPDGRKKQHYAHAGADGAVRK